MKITPFTLIQNKPFIQKQEQNSNITHTNHQTNTMLPYSYNAYLINFEARVDKGLERFTEANEERMPHTVKAFLETVDDKSTLTPLEAQQKAFEMLTIADSPEDIKKTFSDEKLFAELINPEQSNARRGIIKAYNDYAPILAEEGKGVLKSKENLTVYLVKKIFLENKTIEEINKDLEFDLEPDFKQAFLFHNEDAKLVHPATLSALGIKTPGREYLQSLRYTREGYSDLIGGKIKSSLEAFYDSLSDEERTMRAKKTVANCENWWATLSTKQKLELLADKEAELKMLEQYNAHRQQTKKTTPKSSTKASTPDAKPRTHVKVGSTKLAQDELFKKWATFNLQIFRENLTDAEKAELNIIQTRNMSRRWHEMSALERTEYLSKMKSGQEPIRFAMLDAWNNCTDIIKDLTVHLKKNQIYKPADLLFSTQEFSILQSQIMTEFWEAHPEHAVKLGEAIQTSHQKIKDAMANGHFEELKREIGRDKTRRIKEIENFKFDLTPKTTTTDYMKEFRKAFMADELAYGRIKYLPDNYIDDYFSVIEKGFSEHDIRVWTNSLLRLPQSEEDIETIKRIGRTTPPEGLRVNRAIETTLANILYDSSKNPVVYDLEQADLKALFEGYQNNQNGFNITTKSGQHTKIVFQTHKKIDKKQLASMYETFKRPLTEEEASKIVNNFFEVTDDESAKELQKYISEFGKTAELIFSEKSAYPPTIKNKLYDKFMVRMPEKLFGKVASLLDLHTNPFEREAQIKKVNFLLNKRFDFIPKPIMDVFNEELSRSLRREKYDISMVEARVGSKRISANETKGLLILPKQNFLIQNKLRMLAAEQVLAEALYDATKNPEVFSLPFEQLCDNIEVFGLIKKFPTDTRTFEKHYTGETMELVANKRIDLRNAAKEYIDCINDVIDNWLNTKVKTDGFGKMLNLVDTLSCGETDPKILANIVKRVTLYGLNLK